MRISAIALALKQTWKMHLASVVLSALTILELDRWFYYGRFIDTNSPLGPTYAWPLGLDRFSSYRHFPLLYYMVNGASLWWLFVLALLVFGAISFGLRRQREGRLAARLCLTLSITANIFALALLVLELHHATDMLAVVGGSLKHLQNICPQATRP